MKTILSLVIPVIVFSCLFYMIPLSMSKRHKRYMVIASIFCFLIAKVAFMIFPYGIAAAITLLFILCLTILLYPREQWFEDNPGMNQAENLEPKFDYDDLREKAAMAENIDIPIQPNAGFEEGRPNFLRDEITAPPMETEYDVSTITALNEDESMQEMYQKRFEAFEEEANPSQQNESSFEDILARRTNKTDEKGDPS
ncbi:hypothetical protein N1I87_14230 [Bacillus sp. FSL W8-0102]|uniref:hypothetical protein n=1 Tax=unclassified Bacillus (in: firmicutes) TaxID=185979 RepID=UPI0030FAB713